ncbi:hypothetical protein RFI_00189, partial [Reticulomyxa filosa]
IDCITTGFLNKRRRKINFLIKKNLMSATLTAQELRSVQVLIQSQITLSCFRHLDSWSRLFLKRESSDKSINVDDDQIGQRQNMLSSLEMNSLLNMRTEYNELFEMLCKTMDRKMKENTSVLLVGKHGYGKSSLLHMALHQLRAKYGADKFHCIYLNGLLHSDDVIAMHELVRELSNQRCSQDAVDGNKGKGSHAPFVNELEYLVQQLQFFVNQSRTQQGSDTAVDHVYAPPVFIILDHMELFCMRPKQTLLYNLFDLLQMKSDSFNIIGLTAHKAIDELLEKRIRSRFIHKKILVFQKPIDLSLSQRLFSHIHIHLFGTLYIFVFLFFFFFYLFVCLLNEKDNGEKTNVQLTKNHIDIYNNWVENEILNGRKLNQRLRRFFSLGFSPQQFLLLSAFISQYIQPCYFENVSSGVNECPSLQIKFADKAKPLQKRRRRRLNATNSVPKCDDENNKENMSGIGNENKRKTEHGENGKKEEDNKDDKNVEKKTKFCIDEMIVNEMSQSVPFLMNPQLLLINDLSVNELLLLVVACKLDNCDICVFNFEMLMQRLKTLEHYTTHLMHKTSRLLHVRAFEQLLQMKFFVPINNPLAHISSTLFAHSKKKLSSDTVFHPNYQNVRLNCKSIGSSADMLQCIKENATQAPLWMKDWLTKNTTHIHS